MLLRAFQSHAAPKQTAAAPPSATRFKIRKTSMKDLEQNGQVVSFGVASEVTGSGLGLVLSGQDAGVSVARAVQSGIFLDGVLTEVQSGEFVSSLERAQVQLREVEIPSNRLQRQKFLAAWSEAARKAAKKGLGISMLLLPLSACKSDGVSDVASTKGFVIDGYISDAFIFRDENENGIFDSGEASSRTGSDGSFALGGDETKSIVVDGSDGRARDLDNPDEAFMGILLAPAGSTVVTPLTTLVQQLVEAGETVASATAAVKQALGITSDADLLSTDPIASENIEVYKAGVQVAGLIAAAGGGAAGLAVTKALSQAVKTASESSSSVDLTNADAVKAVMDVAKSANPTAMSGFDTDAAASTAASKASSVGEATTIGGVAEVQSATFTVSEANDVVTFGGSASGSVVMILNASGGASFSRAGVDGKNSSSADASVVTVDNIASKSIAGSIDLTVVVTANATSGEDVFVIDAADATKITIRGSMGEGADNITIKIADKTASETDVRLLTLDTSNLTVTAEDQVTFEFAGAEDLVILNEASNISQFSTIEVAKGTADLRSVTIKDDADFIVNSGVILSQDQFVSLSSLISVTGDGNLTIALSGSQTIDTLNTALVSSQMTLIGANITVLGTDGTTVLLRTGFEVNAVGTAPANLAAISFPGIPQLTQMVEDLQTAIEGEGFSNSTLTTLAALSSAIDTLNGDEDAAGSVQKAIIDALGEEPTFNEGTGRFIVSDLGDDQTVANAMAELLNGAFDYTDAAIANLQTDVASNDVDIAALAVRATGLETAVTLLNDSACVFRRIRPPIPTTSGHLFRAIRPPVTRCHEAACFGYQS
jgi:hypothetical protein